MPVLVHTQSFSINFRKKIASVSSTPYNRVIKVCSGPLNNRNTICTKTVPNNRFLEESVIDYTVLTDVLYSR